MYLNLKKDVVNSDKYCSFIDNEPNMSQYIESYNIKSNSHVKITKIKRKRRYGYKLFIDQLYMTVHYFFRIDYSQKIYIPKFEAEQPLYT